MQKNITGAHFEILLDGKSRSYRDRKEVAIEAARFLKDRNLNSEVTVRDVRDNSVSSSVRI
jgi:hypothetical protein